MFFATVRKNHMTLREILLRAMLWSLGFAAVTGVAAVLFGGGDLIARVIGTGVAMAAACGAILPMGGPIDRAKTRPSDTGSTCRFPGRCRPRQDVCVSEAQRWLLRQPCTES